MQESNNNNNNMDTSCADRVLFLIKSPALISRSFESSSSSSYSSSSLTSINNKNVIPVAKLVLSLDALCPTDDDATQGFW
ncbi:hypothetical protein KSS87_017621 [Heliosperma pusillum]|nr:hypothetical protein KSS87_017621 [Heliosperma pusillum]